MAKKPVIDSVTGTATTGHEWDGIQELNTPLPRWWLTVFYATIAFSVVYVILFPAIPLGTAATTGVFGYSSRVEVEQKIEKAKLAQKGMLDQIAAATPEQILAGTDPRLRSFAQQGGRAAFSVHCATCHGAGGAGQAGVYPVLADDDWIWGGSIDAIHATIQHGVRNETADARQSEMPVFGDGVLTPAQIDDVATYVLTLVGDAPSDAAAADRGAPLYAENCSACHGEKGEGQPDLGAPRLADRIWLYGGTKEKIVAQISKPKLGVMPAWGQRLDANTVKMLAVYVHSLGGGQ